MMMQETDTKLFDDAIEQAAIGVMVMNCESPSVAQADFDLQPKMFYRPAHHLLVQELYDLHTERHGYVDPVMLQQRLRAKGLLGELPDEQYLMKCSELAPIHFNQHHYFKTVVDLYMKRQVIKVADEVAGDAKGTLNAQEFLMEVPQRFFDLIPVKTNEMPFEESLKKIRDQWADIRDGKVGMPGLMTGIKDLDESLTGLKPGSYTCIAARPGSGKTSLAGDIVDFQCEQGVPVGWLNMDMPRNELEARWLCRRGKVSMPKLNSGNAFGKNFADIDKAVESVSKWPLHTLHANRDILKACSWVRLKAKREGIKMLVADYAQKFTADHIRSHDPVRVISYCSAVMKELCQELEIPLLMLCQLGREDKRAPMKAPTMDDIKGCGDIEQDAQNILLLHKYPKFDYELAKVNEVTDRAIYLDIAKQQNGGVGILPFWFRTSYFTMQRAPKDWGHPEALG